MALIVVPADGGEALCSVAAADAYHASRSNGAAWAAIDGTRKEQLLRDAFDYLLGEYGASWPTGQAFGVDAEGAVPLRVAHANALLALRAKDGPLDAEVTPQKIRSEVGPIKSEFAPRENGGRRTFPDVARLIGPHLAPLSLYSVRLERA